jgi:bifunctional aspartokinase / homoserine dehydrogenase 1
MGAHFSRFSGRVGVRAQLPKKQYLVAPALDAVPPKSGAERLGPRPAMSAKAKKPSKRSATRRPAAGRGLVVYKFGGASMSDAAAFKHAATIVKASESPVVVVCSAPAGVTDLLLAVAREAHAGNIPAVEKAIEDLRAKYLHIARGLGLKAAPRKVLEQEIDARLSELEAIGRGLAAVGELTLRTTDLIVSRGERMGTRLFQATLEAAGIKSEYVDAIDLVSTHGPYGGASPDMPATDKRIKARLAPLVARGIVPAVPGFIGAFYPDGDDSKAPDTVTLGRGGTDLTATLVARGLGASSVSLWKDVPGLMTADPRVVPDARIVPQLNVREAGELAYYGAKVLHPRALTPVAGKDIPVFVRPFADPTAIGTEISARHTLDRYPVKALSAATGQALVTIAGRGLLGVPGVAARAFATLSQHGLSVSLITQSSSEQTICFTVPESQARAAQSALQQTFREEIGRRDVDSIQILPGMATIAVVGLGMAGHVGIAARVFTALAAGNVNLIAIAQGSSELNISFVVAASQSGEAQRRIHDAFQLSKIGGGAMSGQESVDVVLLGFGQIGQTLAAMIVRGKRDKGSLPKKAAKLRVVAAIDSSGFIFNPEGLSAAQVATAIRDKKQGKGLSKTAGGHRGSGTDALRMLTRHALTRPILVDNTAHDTSALLCAAAEAGMDLVLANKRPLSALKAEDEKLRAAVRKGAGRIRFEATVGAGLPVIDTCRKLVESGDKVLKIEGCLSGTLGFLLTEVSRGRKFSESVLDAMKRGYTEPDPRDDLSGKDVARKALILGRLLGFDGDPADVAVESLVPVAAQKLSREAFVSRLTEWDEEWRKRAESAQAKNSVLRYVATVTGKKLSVGLERVARGTPFASLEGTDNQIAFTTVRYRSPLVITGAGAGLEVTAGGVLNDILDLVE